MVAIEKRTISRVVIDVSMGQFLTMPIQKFELEK